MKKTILIIEDEPGLIFMLRDSLELEGYRVLIAEDGNRGITLALDEYPDLILLDIMLPGRNGWDVCQSLRARGYDAPIIMLTVKNSTTEKVHGFNLGADDYVTKPFSMAELLSRIETRIRRTKIADITSEILHIEQLSIDFRNMIAYKSGEPIQLSAREFQILKFFLEHRGQLITREQLMSAVWGIKQSCSSRTVDMHICKLRQKIEEHPQKPRLLVTVHWAGYKFIG